jgi:hypothetical protein
MDTYFEGQPENIMEARGKRMVYTGWGQLPRADETQEEYERRGSESTNSSASAARDAVSGKAAKAWRAARRRSKEVTSSFFR